MKIQWFSYMVTRSFIFRTQKYILIGNHLIIGTTGRGILFASHGRNTCLLEINLFHRSRHHSSLLFIEHGDSLPQTCQSYPVDWEKENFVLLITTLYFVMCPIVQKSDCFDLNLSCMEYIRWVLHEEDYLRLSFPLRVACGRQALVAPHQGSFISSQRRLQRGEHTFWLSWNSCVLQSGHV